MQIVGVVVDSILNLEHSFERVGSIQFYLNSRRLRIFVVFRQVGGCYKKIGSSRFIRLIIHLNDGDDDDVEIDKKNKLNTL